MGDGFRVHGRAAARRPAVPGPRNGPVITLRVAPAVWGTALELADGNAARLRVIDARTVLVVNRP